MGTTNSCYIEVHRITNRRRRQQHLRDSSKFELVKIFTHKAIKLPVNPSIVAIGPPMRTTKLENKETKQGRNKELVEKLDGEINRQYTKTWSTKDRKTDRVCTHDKLTDDTSDHRGQGAPVCMPLFHARDAAATRAAPTAPASS